MAARTRTFSVYLLKTSITPDDALRAGHALTENSEATALPTGARLFIGDFAAKDPWWKGYFGIQKNLAQTSKSAIVFVPSGNRWLALTFGHSSHALDDDKYEHDFGILVTLNSVERGSLRSTDVFEPGSARRRRIQLPRASDLTLFDFDQDSNILRSLTGKVKEDRRHLFKDATGASNLRITSKLGPDELEHLGDELLSIYKSTEYLESFPEIRSVSPVKDPSIVGQLNDRLVSAIRDKSDSVDVTVPDILNNSEGLRISFFGEGRGSTYDGAGIWEYYEYLKARQFAVEGLTLADLKRQSMLITDPDGVTRNRHSIYKTIIFDTRLSPTGPIYNLNEGNWYKFEQEYVDDLRTYLDPLYEDDTSLPTYTGQTEGEYNEKVAADDDSFICLDKKNISPKKHTAIEPCDLISAEDGKAILRHVKICTRSALLSHLFNQGVNSIEIIHLSSESKKALLDLVENDSNPHATIIASLIKDNAFKVRYSIITAKDPAKKSGNLPLFSQMSLMRALKALQLMGTPRSYSFIKDASVPKSKVSSSDGSDEV